MDYRRVGSLLSAPILVLALAGPAGAVPAGAGSSTAPAAGAVEAPAPVTLVSLTDTAGEPTPVAVSGLEELAAQVASEPENVAFAGPVARGGLGASLPLRVIDPDVETVEPSDLEPIVVLTPPIDTREFLVAGVTWSGEDSLPAGAVIHIRVLEDGVWSEWLASEPDDAAPDDGEPVAGTDPFITGGADAVQIQVTSPRGGALPADLGLNLFPSNPAPTTEVITEAPEDPATPPTEEPIAPTEVEPMVAKESAVFGSAVLVGPMGSRTSSTASRAVQRAALAPGIAPAALATPSITSRAGWGADSSIFSWSPTYVAVKAAVVHHTAGTNTYTASQSASIVRGIYRYHAVTRGWGDIGYNFLVDKYGQVFEGRYGSLTAGAGVLPVGAHAAGFNTGTLGISAMGDYTQVNAPQVILDTMASVVAWKFSTAGVDMSTTSGFVSPGTAYRPAGQALPRIFAHRDVGATVCPGNDIYGRMSTLISSVTSRLATSTGAATTPAVNVARTANPTVAASSQNTGTGQGAAKAVDGSTLGFPADATKEWATVGGRAGSWIDLTWPVPVTIDRVVLFDRPNTNDQVTAGTLSFSGGASVTVGALANAGTATTVSFSSRTVTSLRLTVTSVSAGTANVGLAEIQVWGTAPAAPAAPAPAPDPAPSQAAPAGSNLARAATAGVSASSQNTSTGQTAAKAVDGSPLGYPTASANEWATAGGRAGSWLQITWPSPVSLDRVVLYDRPNTADQVTGGTLTFSDGSSVAVGALVNTGTATTVTFPARTVTSVRLTVGSVSASTLNVGLAELEAWGTTASSANVARISGPAVTASSANSSTSQTAAKAVDGSPVGYPADHTKEWATVGGRSGSWLQLTWPGPVTVNKVVLYDRPNSNDQATAGTLTFSDGTTVNVGALNNAGGATTVTFSPRTVTSVRFTATAVSASTANVGLAELEVWSPAP